MHFFFCFEKIKGEKLSDKSKRKQQKKYKTKQRQRETNKHTKIKKKRKKSKKKKHQKIQATKKKTLKTTKKKVSCNIPDNTTNKSRDFAKERGESFSWDEEEPEEREEVEGGEVERRESILPLEPSFIISRKLRFVVACLSLLRVRDGLLVSPAREVRSGEKREEKERRETDREREGETDRERGRERREVSFVVACISFC